MSVSRVLARGASKITRELLELQKEHTLFHGKFWSKIFWLNTSTYDHESKMESTNLVTNVCHFSIINRVAGGFQNLTRTSPWWIDLRFTLRIFFSSHFHLFHHSGSQILYYFYICYDYIIATNWLLLTQRKERNLTKLRMWAKFRARADSK